LGWITSTAWYDKDLLSISISTWNWTSISISISSLTRQDSSQDAPLDWSIFFGAGLRIEKIVKKLVFFGNGLRRSFFSFHYRSHVWCIFFSLSCLGFYGYRWHIGGFIWNVLFFGFDLRLQFMTPSPPHFPFGFWCSCSCSCWWLCLLMFMSMLWFYHLWVMCFLFLFMSFSSSFSFCLPSWLNASYDAILHYAFLRSSLDVISYRRGLLGWDGMRGWD
jgi:hypothetical protein